MTFKPDLISARNAELRAMLLEAQGYRMQGRPILAEILEQEAVKYRAVTLAMGKDSQVLA